MVSLKVKIELNEIYSNLHRPLLRAGFIKIPLPSIAVTHLATRLWTARGTRFSFWYVPDAVYRVHSATEHCISRSNLQGVDRFFTPIPIHNNPLDLSL